MPKLKKYIKVKDKYICNTILQMRLSNKVSLGPKRNAMDFSNYNQRNMDLLMGSLRTYFGIKEVEMVILNE